MGTYLTIREYIRTTPGKFMPATTWDDVTLALWLVGLVAVAVPGVGRFRRRPAAATPV